VLFFLLTVAPALGFVNVYPFRFSFVADHFQYLASLGLITLATAGVARRVTGQALAVVSAVVALALGMLTWNQAGHYRDAETLYAATLDRNPDSWLAHNNLAALRLERPDEGAASAALEHARASLRVQPRDNPVAHYNAAMALEQLGQFDAAVGHYRASLEQFAPAQPPQPRVARTLNRMGQALAARGQDDEALAAFRRAVEFDPGDPGMHTDLGVALARAGRVPEAIAAFEEAVRLSPTAEALSNLGGALLQAGRPDEAVVQFEAAVRLNPALVDAHYNRALALDRLGRHPEALEAYRRVLALGAASADLHNDIGALLVELGQPSEAVSHFRMALQLDPNHTTAQANLRAVDR
jgi:protein O-mannosyl-transferase